MNRAYVWEYIQVASARNGIILNLPALGVLYLAVPLMPRIRSLCRQIAQRLKDTGSLLPERFPILTADMLAQPGRETVGWDAAPGVTGSGSGLPDSEARDVLRTVPVSW